MARDRHACARDGALLVDAAGVVPACPEDYVWPWPSPSIGCNALACARCGARLRHEAGWRLAADLAPESMAFLHGLPDWSRHGGCLVATSIERTWVCRCNGLSVSFPRALFEGGVADDHPAPVGWHCASHPALVLPVELDGVRLANSESLSREVVGAMLRGSLPGQRPAWLGPAPAEWLVRLWFELADRDLADALVEAVAEHLAPDCEALASALHFFTALPPESAARASARLDALVPRPLSLAEASAPYPPHEPLSRLVQRLSRRLARG